MSDNSLRKVKVINASGPYGVGKDTALRLLVTKLGDKAWRVPTLTTRQSRAGFDPTYRSVSQKELEEVISHGSWLINSQLGARVHYATNLDEIEVQIREGRVAVLSLYAGPDGAGQLRSYFGSRLLSFGLLATGSSEDKEIAELAARL